MAVSISANVFEPAVGRGTNCGKEAQRPARGTMVAFLWFLRPLEADQLSVCADATNELFSQSNCVCRQLAGNLHAGRRNGQIFDTVYHLEPRRRGRCGT